MALSLVSWRGGQRVSARMFNALTNIEKDSGKQIVVTSGYRTIAQQTALYNDFMAGRRAGPVARPGKSMHNTGDAVDVPPATQVVLRDFGSKYGLNWFGPGDPVHFSFSARGGQTQGKSAPVHSSDSAALKKIDKQYSGISGFVYDNVIKPVSSGFEYFVIFIIGVILVLKYLEAQTGLNPASIVAATHGIKK